MRRFLTLCVFVPIAVVIVVLSVANRASVTFSLDPVGGDAPGWSATAPLYVFLFVAVMVGIVIGGVATWVRQGHWRRAARFERANAERLRGDVARLRERLETIPALSAPRDRDAA